MSPVRLRTAFSVPKMDCPSEERLIRMALDGVAQIEAIEVDLDLRRVEVVHGSEPESLLEHLAKLNLGAELLETHEETEAPSPANTESEAPVLRQLLLINAVMFVVEIAVGWFAESTGLMADGLDMLADGWVYGLALYAVGRSRNLQRQAARLSGYAQLTLAGLALLEVVRRSAVGSEPHSTAMMSVAAIALIANLACIALLHRHRQGGLHMRASWIFSTNDAIANLGVIIAGGLVYATGSPLPDLVIGTLIALVVLRGARRILSLSAPTGVAPTH